jgi:hypothetical protein
MSSASRKRLRDDTSRDDTSLDRRPDTSCRNNVAIFDASCLKSQVIADKNLPKTFSPYTSTPHSKTESFSFKKSKENVSTLNTQAPKNNATLKSVLHTSSTPNKSAGQGPSTPKSVRKVEKVESEKKKKALATDDFDNPENYRKYSKKQLWSHCILVQTRQYKNDKRLPIVGGIKLLVERGQVITFYKKGPKIWMQVCETIYVPEVEPEHVAGIFRDFSEEELLRNDRGEKLGELKCPICEKQFTCEKKLVEHCSECDTAQSR